MYLIFPLVATLINVGVSLSESVEYHQNGILSPSINRNQNTGFTNNNGNDLSLKLKQRALENLKDHSNWNKFNYKVEQNFRDIPTHTEPIDDLLFDYFGNKQFYCFIFIFSINKKNILHFFFIHLLRAVERMTLKNILQCNESIPHEKIVVLIYVLLYLLRYCKDIGQMSKILIKNTRIHIDFVG